MTLVHDRFQILDPELKELVETFQFRWGAFQAAKRHAKRRGYDMEVFDAMARNGFTNVWRISPTGEVTNQDTKTARPEVSR